MSDRNRLFEYLKGHDLMILATCGKRPAACTVYYGVDKDFSLYIVTSPLTEHGKNIQENHKAACVITETTQALFDTKYKIGVQLYETAKEIKKKKEMEKSISIWSRGKKDVVKSIMEGMVNNTRQSRPFVIVPKEIKWFNEELYSAEGTKTFKFS